MAKCSRPPCSQLQLSTRHHSPSSKMSLSSLPPDRTIAAYDGPSTTAPDGLKRPPILLHLEREADHAADEGQRTEAHGVRVLLGLPHRLQSPRRLLVALQLLFVLALQLLLVNVQLQLVALLLVALQLLLAGGHLRLEAPLQDPRERPTVRSRGGGLAVITTSPRHAAAEDHVASTPCEHAGDHLEFHGREHRAQPAPRGPLLMIVRCRPELLLMARLLMSHGGGGLQQRGYPPVASCSDVAASEGEITQFPSACHKMHFMTLHPYCAPTLWIDSSGPTILHGDYSGYTALQFRPARGILTLHRAFRASSNSHGEARRPALSAALFQRRYRCVGLVCLFLASLLAVLALVLQLAPQLLECLLLEPRLLPRKWAVACDPAPKGLVVREAEGELLCEGDALVHVRQRLERVEESAIAEGVLPATPCVAL
eukprot:scaffold1967_cov60-Phaeocystis_antarctica.AAC.4